MDRQKMVEEFHYQTGALVNDSPVFVDEDTCELRLSLIAEELKELKDAIADKNLYEVSDALADLLYVTYGAAVTFGIDIAPVFEEVHRSNMTKDGSSKRADGKVLKGKSYEPPDIVSVLNRQLLNTKTKGRSL